MILPIDDTTRIVSDELNWIVQRCFKSKKGATAGLMIWRSERYYPKLQQAVVSVLNSELKGSEAKDLHSLLNDLEAATERIERAVRKMEEGSKDGRH